VALEEAALQSGLDSKGDFKVTNFHYEEMPTRAGFAWSKNCIGPLDRDDLGGVYVYRNVRRRT
jgi:hypothetical protein